MQEPRSPQPTRSLQSRLTLFLILMYMVAERITMRITAIEVVIMMSNLPFSWWYECRNINQWILVFSKTTALIRFEIWLLLSDLATQLHCLWHFPKSIFYFEIWLINFDCISDLASELHRLWPGRHNSVLSSSQSSWPQVFSCHYDDDWWWLWWW